MSLFRKNRKAENQVISTASLPDIVFMLLFFFMVTTVMRNQDLLVKVIQPKATEVAKLTNNSLVSHIYIGKPYDIRLGDQPRIQLNDAIRDTKDIKSFVYQEREKRSQIDVPKMIFSLEVNESTQMGIVSDVKQELRIAEALKINYSARRELKKGF